MVHSLPMMEARRVLTRLPREFEMNPRLGAMAVTKRGKPVLAVIPWDLYESLTETLDIMADRTLMARLRKSLAEAAAGRLIPWEEVKRKLDL